MAWDSAAAARWIAEAVQTGNALASLPDGIAPRSVAEGEEIAFAVLAELDIVPCGVRLLLREDAPSLAGPMIEGRLLPDGAPVALGALRSPVVTAAVIGVLSAALQPDESEPPQFAAVHAAIDVAATRFADAPDDDRLIAADLGGLGFVVAGRRKTVWPDRTPVSLGAPGGRRTARHCDLVTAFGEAARVARKLGGLPAGALLVVAGLSTAMPAAGALSAAFGPLGRVTARFA